MIWYIDMSVEKFPDTSQYPDHIYFDTNAISWEMESPEGWDARYGVIQPGFEQRFPTPITGERIRLYEPTGEQELEISVLDEEGKTESTHYLSGENTIVHVTGGRDILISTPKGQGDIGYICDYPGRRPTFNDRFVTFGDFDRVWSGQRVKASWDAMGRFATDFDDFPMQQIVGEDGSVSYKGDIAAAIRWIRTNRDGVSRFILERMLQESSE